MDFNTSHDIVHKNAGGSKECEYCQGKIDKAACKKRAEELIVEQNEKRNNMNRGMYAFTEKDKIVTAIDVQELAQQYFKENNEAGLPAEIKVVPVGKWNTTKYGNVEIKDSDLEAMVKNFSLRKGIPIDTDHDSGAANGWVTKLIHKAGDGLYAAIEWTKKGEEYLSDKIYKYFSPEFSLNYRDPQTSKLHGPVFLAGTLTNRPLFKNLPAIVANEYLTKDLTGGNLSVILLSEEQNTMDLKTLKDKALTELTADELSFVKENANQLTPQERMKFNLATDEDKKAISAAEMKKCATCDKEMPAGEMDEHMKTHTKKATEDDEVKIKASELEELKARAAKADEAIKAKEEQEKTVKATEKVESTYLFNETTQKGKVLPKAKDTLVKLVLSFSEEQQKMFDEVIEAVNTSLDFSEKGNSQDNSHLTTAKEADKIIAEIMANEKVDYAKAVTLFAERNPELYQKYNEEVEGVK